MNDKLLDAFSDVANSLGVSINQMVNQLIFMATASIILFCISCILYYKFYKLYLKREDEYHKPDGQIVKRPFYSDNVYYFDIDVKRTLDETGQNK